MFLKTMAFQNAYLNPVIRAFGQNLKGATAIEYGLIAGGISIVIMVAVFTVGSDLKTMFTFMDAKLTSAATTVK